MLNRPSKADVDMTPMVDVTFLLLIFFMATASFSMQRSIAVTRQPAEGPSPRPELTLTSVVDVSVDQRGLFWVRCDSWNREIVGKQSLITSLKEVVAAQGAETKVHVAVDDQAKLKLLVDALDAIAAAGLTEVSVTQVNDVDEIANSLATKWRQHLAGGVSPRFNFNLGLTHQAKRCRAFGTKTA